MNKQVDSNPEKPESSPVISNTLALVLERAVACGASDVHWHSGAMPLMRVAGDLQPLQLPQGGAAVRLDASVEGLLNGVQRQRLRENGAVDGAFSAVDESRWRFNAYRVQGELACAFRLLESQFRDLADLGLPASLYDVCQARAGLVLVAGPTGSGKSTTLAALIHHINRQRRCHVITIEDPVEYIHRSQTALISQRQIGWDAPSFYQALLDALRQDPDVILVGEIRDLNTIRTAITAAETGHLVFATVHAADCIGAIDRLISVFPGEEQSAIQHLLSMTLRTIVAQHLVPVREAYHSNQPADDSSNHHRDQRRRVLVSEVLQGSAAVSNLITQMNLKQLRSVMETGAAAGMYTLDQCLARLLRKRQISEGTARGLAHNPQLVIDLARRSERTAVEAS